MYISKTGTLSPHIILALVIGLAGCAGNQSTKMPDDMFKLRITQISKSVTEKIYQTDKQLDPALGYPRSTTDDGKWKQVQPKDWTSGFFPGILWYANELRGEDKFQASAQRWTNGLKQMQFHSGSHDIGFIVFCSFGNGYRLTKDPEYKNVVLQAAKTLTTRFNPNVGCIRSWDFGKWQYPVIIDNMMNLELLFWASKNGGTQEMHDIAFRHAENTMRNHFRPDGSTYHVLSYDTTNGNVISKGTHQGYSDESCWARGQAWAIYGFTMSYRFTHDERFLKTAQRAADYFIKNLPDDHVPYWDFQAPNIPNEFRDASAAAIAASGLFELSTYGDDELLKKKYYDAAVEILSSLSSPAYFSNDLTSPGLVRHMVGHNPANSELDVTLIYGDYYFVEALLRYKNGGE